MKLYIADNFLEIFFIFIILHPPPRLHI